MKWFNTIVISLALVAAFIFGRQCSEPEIITNTIEKVTIKTDTIWPDTTVVYKPKLVRDTMYYLIPYRSETDSLRLTTLNATRVYERAYRDTNQYVKVTDTIIGYLIGQNVEYRLFVPLTIKDSITIEKVSVIAPKWELKGGFDISRNNTFLSMAFTKNRHTFVAGYDPFKKEPTIGYKYTFLKR